MKKLTKIVASFLVVGPLAVTSVTAFAAPETQNVTATNWAVPMGFSNNTPKGAKDFNFRGEFEFTEEQKAEMTAKMKEKLAQQLADGRITQEQYDQAIADIAEGKMPMGRGQDSKVRPELTDEQKAEMTDKMKEKLAQQLTDGNITQEQYDQAIADIAEGRMPMGRGQDSKVRPELTDEQKAEMADKMKEKLAQQLADGKITQEQYNQAIADIAEGRMPMGRGQERK